MTYPIHDLYIRPLEIEATLEGSSLAVLRYSDHLLRRFGLAEIVTIEAGNTRASHVRAKADEVWALLDGAVEFGWLDQRDKSPSEGESFQFRCEDPTLVLVPFGVKFEIVAFGGSAQLLRLATHESESE